MASLELRSAKERKLIQDRLKELGIQDSKEKKLQENLKRDKAELEEQTQKTILAIQDVQSNIDAKEEEIAKLAEQISSRKQASDRKKDRLNEKKDELDRKVADLNEEKQKKEKHLDNLFIGLPDQTDCPVCLEKLFHPKTIFQCVRSHIICGTCLDTLKSERSMSRPPCPTCREEGEYIRSHFLEGLHRDVAKSNEMPMEEKQKNLTVIAKEIEDFKVTIGEKRDEMNKIGDDLNQIDEDSSQELKAPEQEKFELEDELAELKKKKTAKKNKLEELKSKQTELDEDFDRKVTELTQENIGQQLVPLEARTELSAPDAAQAASTLQTSDSDTATMSWQTISTVYS